MCKVRYLPFFFLFTFLFVLGTGNVYAQEKAEEPPLFTVWANKEHVLDTNLTHKTVRPRVGLVLSGGGAKGMAHVGVLKVLEELNIPIDYIGGTSMGSIIGGLYAYGYSAHELDSIVRAANWGQLLNDKPDWAYVFYEDKKNYMLSLPFSFHGESSLTPVGFIKGQHIDNLFYTLTSQSYKYKTFKDFNTPYFCAVADIMTGKAIYFDSGNLAMSMRSSMAVPGVFAPVSLDTMLLVDGGVLNNFPVDIMLERGADIVIGVDVGFDYAGVTPQSSNFLDILQQVIFMGSKSRVVDNRNSCDVLIRPDMHGFSSTSFAKADSLLARGESAARAHETYKALQHLARELASYQQDAPKEKKPYLPPEQVFVSEIQYEGLSKYNEGYINQFMQVAPGRWSKLSDITEGVKRLYGTTVFRLVSYEFKQDPEHEDAVILVIKVEEAPSNILSVGVKFDNDRSAALLAGIELRNFGFKNSLLMADLELSKMLNVKIDYIVRPDWKLRKKKKFSLWVPSAGLNFEYNRFATQLYRDPNNMRRNTNAIISNRYRVRLYAQSNWKLNIFGLGATYEYATNVYSPKTDTLYRHDVYNNAYFYLYLYFKHDSYNKKFYPTKGSKMTIEVSSPTLVSKPGSEARLNNLARNYLSAYWTADFACGIGKKKNFVLYPGFTIGAILFRNNREIPIQHQFFQGSCTDFSGWYNSPLPGVLLGQSSGYFIANMRLTAQVMIVKNLYLSLRGGVGRTEYELKDWLDMKRMKRIIYGGNIGLSYDTPVGPVGISFQSSNVHPFNVFLNIGYWF